MGKIGTVSQTIDGDNEREILAEYYDGYTKQSPIIAPAGIETNPIEGDIAFIEKMGESNCQAFCLGVKQKAVIDKGEIRIFSRDENGVIKSQVHVKKDGSVEILNDFGSIIIDATGLTEIKSSAFTLLQALTTIINAIKTGVIDPSNYAFNVGTISAIEAGLLQLNQVIK